MIDYWRWWLISEFDRMSEIRTGMVARANVDTILFNTASMRPERGNLIVGEGRPSLLKIFDWKVD